MHDGQGDGGEQDPDAEAAQWLHERSEQYEDRDDLLNTSSGHAGGRSEGGFDGTVTVESVELHCFGRSDQIIWLDFTSNDDVESIEVDITCADGMHEVVLEETDVDHSAVSSLAVRSSPSDNRYYVVALGSLN